MSGWSEVAKYLFKAGSKKLMQFFTAGTVGYEIGKATSNSEEQSTLVNTAVVKAVENHNSNTNSKNVKIILFIFIALAILSVIAWGMKMFSDSRSVNHGGNIELRPVQHRCNGTTSV